jgi:2-dehydro-3-deoxyphosphogluconate aldolase/(4S)-4-hydroxy-2-oxoglutarate aldolase
MNADAALQLIAEVGIIPSVRVTSAADARFAAEIVYAAGISIVEITMTTPGAIEVIAGLAKSMPELLVGAGSVLDVLTARQCIDAGASFITSPGFDRPLVELTLKKGALALPGALTPSEVMAARYAGVKAIKVFPCAGFGGPAYIKALRAPFPRMQFVAAGGITQQTAADFIRAGAVAIGVGTELIPRAAIQQRDQRWISELAHRFRHLVHEARAGGDEQDEAFGRI